MKQPGQFDRFARKVVTRGITVILGIKNGKSTAQAYRFKKSVFTAAQARAWLKEHNIKYISFEAASGSQRVQAFITLISEPLQAFSSSQVLEMIDPADLEQIRARDPHPFFKAWVLAHEGYLPPC